MKRHDLVDEQIAYYRARAAEYDEWFLRRGRYDHGPAAKQQWLEEVEQVRDALRAFRPTGDVLEIAGGTGWWTEQLAPLATRLTVLDSSPEVLALNRQRLGDASIEYVKANLFSWQPARRYDVVFFGFWLSHVPPERFEAFWAVVAACLGSAGRVFFVDSLYAPQATARDQVLDGPEAVTARRRLNDGREFEIVKVFYRPQELAERLARLGWEVTVQATPTHFLYGSGRRAAAGGDPGSVDTRAGRP